MTQPTGTAGHPDNDHHLYAVYGTDGRVSSRCTSRDHEDGNWVGPHVSRQDVLDRIRTTPLLRRVLDLKDGEQPSESDVGAQMLDDALRLGREEHDRVTHHAVLDVLEPQHEASEEGAAG